MCGETLGSDPCVAWPYLDGVAVHEACMRCSECGNKRPREFVFVATSDFYGDVGGIFCRVCHEKKYRERRISSSVGDDDGPTTTCYGQIVGRVSWCFGSILIRSSELIYFQICDKDDGCVRGPGLRSET